MSALPSPRDPLATLYLDPALIERVVAMDDVLARNAAITRGYHELARAVAAIIGRDHANWLVFGQWARAEARRSMLGESVPAPLRRLLARPVAAAVAAGNAAVFGDVAPPFIRFVRAFADPGLAADPARAAAALAGLCADRQLAASEDLRRSFTAYVDAVGLGARIRAGETDPALALRRAARILVANASVGAHEQVVADPFVRAALPGRSIVAIAATSHLGLRIPDGVLQLDATSRPRPTSAAPSSRPSSRPSTIPTRSPWRRGSARTLARRRTAMPPTGSRTRSGWASSSRLSARASAIPRCSACRPARPRRRSPDGPAGAPVRAGAVSLDGEPPGRASSGPWAARSPCPARSAAGRCPPRAGRGPTMTIKAPTRAPRGKPVTTAPSVTTPPVALPARRIADAAADPRSVPRVDAIPKLLGVTRYTDDFLVPGAWHGSTVRATEAHARLLGIDLDPAFDWSQVVVLTAKDVPGENVIHLMKDDQPVLAADEICHVGEPVALVAAPTLAMAHAARDHVRLRTEPLPAVLDLLASDHVFTEYNIARGDLGAGFAEADLVVEGTYRVGHQEQLYIETQGMIAVPQPDGGVTVHGSLQCPYYVHAAMKRALGLDAERCIVVQEDTGGAFGGKEEFPSGLAIHAAMLALAVGRPVRLIYDRHEDISVTTKRHPGVITHRTGVTRDGRLVAQDIDITYDGGAYATLSSVVLSRGTLHSAGPYACPNVRIHARAVRTHTPPAGAFRGFGAPQTEFAVETHVNRIAEALGISPAELRARWAYQLGDRTPTQQVLRDSVTARETLAAAVKTSDFEARRTAFAAVRRVDRAAGRPRRAPGIGLALGWHGAGFTGGGEKYLASIAGVELSSEGRVRVLSDQTEMGQGMRTVFAQIVGDRLGIPFEDVDVVRQDTSVVPNSGPTVASRTTMVVGGLVARAADRLKAAVAEQAPGPFAATYAEFGRAHGPLRFDEQFTGYPDIEWDDATYVGDAYPAFSWAAATAEVEVDLDTGEVAVKHVVSADDCGTVINPLMAAGQVEGGTLQAVGYATIEEMKLKDGRFLNDRLSKYLIPTSLDAPKITAVLVENPFSNEPHGAKGIGELPMDVVAPAVVAAIHDATGTWITEIPATPEKILAALDAAERDAEEARS